MSAPQTPSHVALLQKLFQYFELAAAVGSVIPVAHINLISAAIETALQEIQQGIPSLNPQQAVPPVPQQMAPVAATVVATNPGPNAQELATT